MDEPPGFVDYAAYPRASDPGQFGPPPRRVRIDAIGEALNLVLKDWMTWVLVTLVLFLSVVVIDAPFIVFSMTRYDFARARANPYEQPSDVMAIAAVMGCVYQFVIGILLTGVTNVGVRRLRGERIEFGAFFNFQGRLKDLVVAELILCPLGLLTTLGGIVGRALSGNPPIGNDPFAMPWGQLGGQFVASWIAFGVMCLVVFVPLLIVDQGLSVGEAFRESMATAGPRFFPVLGLMFVAGLVGIVGIVACCIGVLFTLPIYFLTYSVLYNDFYRKAPLTDPPRDFAEIIPPQAY